MNPEKLKLKEEMTGRVKKDGLRKENPSLLLLSFLQMMLT